VPVRSSRGCSAGDPIFAHRAALAAPARVRESRMKLWPWVWRLAVAALSSAVVAAAALAQPRALTLEPGERITLDGRLDEAAWQRAPMHDDFVQYLPVDRQPPPAGYRTTLQVLAEADALVIGIRAYDPAPDEIRAPLVRRDQVRRDQDFVAVLIDAVGDRRSAQFVRVNAAGVIADGVYIAAGDNEDFAPDFDVDAAVQRLPDGYSVELRLPLLTLRYPHEGGAPWRLMIARSVPRDSSLLLLSAPLTKDGLSFIAEMQVIEGLEGLVERARHQSLLTLRPEITVRGSRESADGRAPRPETKISLGAELKWRPRADWVIDATFNPDFSQVELDVPQLAGNTRFALSVPETRAFFLESTDVIDLPLAAFYSRSVTDPRYGLRATWRAPRADATAWTLADDGGGVVLRPGPFATESFAQDVRSQASLLRAREHLNNDVSLGALFSRREYSGGRGGNDVAGADALWLPDAQDQLRLRGLASRSTAGVDAQGRIALVGVESGHWLEGRWNHRTSGWAANVTVNQVSPRFRNDNGFVEQAGVRRIEIELISRWGEVRMPTGFTAHEFETYSWLQHTGTLTDAANGVDGGHTVSRRWHPGLWFAGPLNAEGWLQMELDAERTRAGGRLLGTRRVGTEIGINPAPWFTRATARLSVGERLDVQADRVGHGAEWLVEAKVRGSLAGFGLESEQQAQQSFINHGGVRALTDSAAQWLGVLHVSARDSLRAVLQATRYRREADALAAIATERSRTRTLSLVFLHRVGIGQSVAVGASAQRSDPGGELRDELFTKAAIAF
jgi:hypothetical protein